MSKQQKLNLARNETTLPLVSIFKKKSGKIDQLVLAVSVFYLCLATASILTAPYCFHTVEGTPCSVLLVVLQFASLQKVSKPLWYCFSALPQPLDVIRAF